MKYAIVVLSLLFAAPAQAQSVAVWRTMLTAWVDDILANRANTSWGPSLKAHSAIAAQLAPIAAMQIEADDSYPTDVLVLMGGGKAGPPQGRSDPPEGNYFLEMARYTGIRITP